MPTVNLGRIKPIQRGAYAAGTAYLPLDLVTYNGQQYICKAASTGNLPSNTSFFDAIVDVSAWSSEKAAPGKIPVARADGRLDPTWYAALLLNASLNDIGVPGTAGFGVGICPSPPAGFSPLPGTTDPLSDNYGNYQFSDGSVMCWIPAFYLRLGHSSNPTYAVYGVNSISIKPLSAYPTEAEANADGFYLHRAFVNAGANQLGVFRDKYDCSLNGTIASSIKNGVPMVSGPATGQVGFSGATANGQTPVNAYCGALQAAKSRGAKFFPESVFIASMLASLSLAHAQASTSATYCAWYDSTGVKNFPKGNNSNSLRDGDDTSVAFTSAGVAACPAFALTGSGSPFSKTTHNGQACGVSDVAGNIWKINLGMTCLAAAKTITGATQTNPVQLTIAAHGYTTGRVAVITGVVGMTQINDKLYRLTVIDANTVSLDGVDGTAFNPYTSGGSCTTGQFYVLKPSMDVAALTSGNTLATDHWGATGVAAQFDAIELNFATAYPDNGLGKRFGNAANAVFDWSTAASRSLAMAGMPASAGMSSPGTNLMGSDYFYQYIRDQICVRSRGSWDHGFTAGSNARSLTAARQDANSTAGFAACRYL